MNAPEQGSSTLVLLPGMDGTGILFEPFISALGAEIKTVVVRYPSDQAWGYEDLEKFVRLQLASLKNFVVVGESFSGPIAAALTARPPTGLLGVILVCSFVSNPRPSLGAMKWLTSFASATLVPIPVLARMLMGRFGTLALKTQLRQAMSELPKATLAARLRAVLAVDHSATLRESSTPLLYLRATQDRVVPASACDTVLANTKIATVVAIEGPHFLLQTCPAECAGVVSAFAEKLGKLPPNSPASKSPRAGRRDLSSLIGMLKYKVPALSTEELCAPVDYAKEAQANGALLCST